MKMPSMASPPIGGAKRPPPRLNPVAQLLRTARRRGLLWTAAQVLLTVVAAWLLWLVAGGFVRWSFESAHWAVVADNLRLFAIGRYPAAEAWRPAAVLVLIAAMAGLEAGRAQRRAAALLLAGLTGGILIAPLVAPLVASADDPTAPGAQLAFLLGSFAAARGTMIATALALMAGWSAGRGLARWAGDDHRRRGSLDRGVLLLSAAAVIVALVLLAGVPRALLPSRVAAGEFLPPSVDPSLWGGLLLTLVLAASAIAISFPLGVLLALGRRSTLPLVRVICTTLIELVRGVPLVTMLYMAALLLPLILPADWTPSNVAKAIAGLTVFAAAYVAEDVRGGLAAVSSGQVEAARALGLRSWQAQRLIVLPQAIRAVVPAIAGQFISLFKDTALVLIIGLRELLGIALNAANQPAHIGRFTEALVFIAIVYFIFSAVLSSASRRMELPGGDHT